MTNQNSKIKNGINGFTLIEALVGIFLILIVFFGIFGAYQLSLKVISQSKMRVMASAIANEKMEEIRNLSYQDVGVVDGYPVGDIPAVQIVSRSGINFTIKTKIDYAIDEYDGIAAPEDTCPNDYKKVEIKVSWLGLAGGEVTSNTLVVPKNLPQECEEKGGILKVSVFNAAGEMVDFPNIEVTNLNTGLVQTAIPESGFYYFVLPPDIEAYKITVTKANFSSERTFGVGEEWEGQTIAIPEKPHATLIEGELTETSFSIDRLSSFTVKTFSEGGVEFFVDSFWNQDKITDFSNVEIMNGEVKLIKANGSYFSEGYIISETIQPSNLVQWNKFNYSEATPPGTKIRYQVLYFDGLNWVLVPDSDLPGNSAGLSPPPIDLDRLGPVDYPAIRLKATLYSSGSQDETPVLYDWQADWLTFDPNPIGNLDFSLRGEKIVGKDSDEKPIYKYAKDCQTDESGQLNLSDLEWDTYYFSVDQTMTGFSLTRTEPDQPVNLPPNSSSEVKLFLEAQNSLLVIVRDGNTADPIFSADVRLYNDGLSYDKNQFTDSEGQTFFIPLEPAVYNIEIQADEYQNFSDTVTVSGQTIEAINLTAL